MPCFHLRLSILHFPIICARQDHFWPHFNFVAEFRCFPLIRLQSNHDISVTRNLSSSISLISSFPRLNSLRTLYINVDVDETSDLAKCCESLGSADSSARHILTDENLEINRSDSLESIAIKDLKERRRREKIGLANKGKVPWNKGKKHNAETCERIKQRTIEALKDPKVRQKMAECHQPHSDQVKNKISSSLRRVWAKRLQCKRSGEKFFRSWAESIAETARTGGPEQEVLDWDSYDKIKQELGQRQLDMDAEKEKAKALPKIRREKKATQVMAKQTEVARKRKLREERKKEKEEKEKEKRKLRLERSNLKRRLKLKEKLSQIRQKVSADGQVSSQKGTVNSHTPAWEKLNLELIKRENLQREASLADQIRAVKSKKAEFATTGSSGILI